MQGSRQFWLWVLLVVQGICATFFVYDALSDWLGREAATPFRHYHLFEMLVSLALLAGVGATISQIRDLTARQKQMRRQLAVASSEFAALIEAQFLRWKLSPAECDVAMLAIKGLSMAEIATLRQTKEGTIKAQCAAVYRKAGVSGRLQLLSYFIEDLLADPLLTDTGQDRQP